MLIRTSRVLLNTYKNFNRLSNTMQSAVSKNLLNSLEDKANSLQIQIRTLSDEVINLKKEIAKCRREIGTSGHKRQADDDTDFEGDDKKSKYTFDTDIEGFVIVYTDGACENNGKQNARAGIGVWFGPNHPLNVAEPVRRRATNNVGEIEACTRAIQIANTAGVKKLSIHTDSEFLINCMTKWLPGWKRKNWVNSKGVKVINKDELQELDTTLKLLDAFKWVHVRGHKGILGNEEADSLAREGAKKYILKK